MSEWRIDTGRCDETISVSNTEYWITLHVSVGDGRVMHTLKTGLKAHEARELAQALLASADSMEKKKEMNS